jgi:hypothetical protein
MIRLAFSVALLIWSMPGMARPFPQHTMDWEGIAAAIIKRLQLEPGEEVVIVAHPDRFQPLIPHLRYGVMAAGGVDLGVILVPAHPYPESWDPEVAEAGFAHSRASYFDMLEQADVGIMMPGANPVHPVYAAFQDLLARKAGPRRTIHFHWTDAYSPSSDDTGLTGVTVLPGHPPPPLHVVDRLYQNAVINSDDAAIARQQAAFAQDLRGATVHVTSPDGTDLRFSVGDRDIIQQNGDASAARMRAGAPFLDREVEVPPGALRVAPMESSVNGVVVYPFSAWNGRTVINARIVYENGRIVSSDADQGAQHLQAELDAAPAESRVFREFGLGFNPLLSVAAANHAWIPYFGYGAGVVRLGLGNNAQLGGDVRGRFFRWRDLLIDATVTLDDTVWVKDGQLIR